MFQDKYVFAQLTGFIDRNRFNYLVKKYQGDHYVKHFTCWNQLLAMMFGQLSNCESLRDLIVVMEAHHGKRYHLGLGREPIAKTTLATANQSRDYRIFEDFAFYMMEEACEKRISNILNISGKNMRLIRLRFHYILQHFLGLSFAERKVALKHMSFMMSKHKFQHSIL